jgi:hypothetical protein
MADLTRYRFNPSELRRIVSGQTGHYETVLETYVGEPIAHLIRTTLEVQQYPPVGERPHPAIRTGRLQSSITPVVTHEANGLVGYVIADVEVAPYATRLRNFLGYDIVTQAEVDEIDLGRI